MFLESLWKPQKFRKIDCLKAIVSQIITKERQLMRVNYRNEKFYRQCSVIQPSLSAIWHNSKSLTPDVDTGMTNGYMNKLIKFLNNYHKFSQNFNCNLSYTKSLSKLKLQHFACGCLSLSKQDFLRQFTAFVNSIYQRYKINFGITEVG